VPRMSVPEPVEDPAATAAGIVEALRALGSERDRAGMARYGINVDDAFGVSVRVIREMAKPLRRDHDLALALWETRIHEARIMAVFVDDPAQVTRAQMEQWALGFDSWDLTDQVTMGLFDLTPYAWDTAPRWAGRPEEFVKRGGFTLMAGLAVHDKKAEDTRFRALLPIIEQQAGDPRNFVKKAVNWALRGIGKRDAALNAEATACARRILSNAGAARDPGARAARWVATDALRELEHEKTRARLGLPALTKGAGS
jgi:3-methyladenine DNA glycosylase AlkD